MQKSVRSVVPKKSVKADGGKGTTLGISQDTVHLNCARKQKTRGGTGCEIVGWKPRVLQECLVRMDVQYAVNSGLSFMPSEPP